MLMQLIHNITEAMCPNCRRPELTIEIYAHWNLGYLSVEFCGHCGHDKIEQDFRLANIHECPQCGKTALRTHIQNLRYYDESLETHISIGTLCHSYCLACGFGDTT